MTNYVIGSVDLKFNPMVSKELKSGFRLPQKNCVICVIGSPLEVMKNVSYIILKALFVLKIFRFLSRLFGHGGKTA